MFKMRPFRSLEFASYWLGGATLGQIGALLGYTNRRMSDLVVVEQGREARRTIAYDPKKKTFDVVDDVTIVNGPNDPFDAVSVLRVAQLWNQPAPSVVGFAIEDVRDHRVRPAADPFRTLLRACSKRLAVEVTYVSKKRRMTIMFSPHAVVSSTYRIHFRGHSRPNSTQLPRWLDLVASRVVSAQVVGRSDFVGDEGDHEWHEMTNVEFVLADSVVGEMRDSVLQEHRCPSGHLVIGPIRRALLRYVVADFLDRRYTGNEGPVWHVAPT